MLHVDDFLNDPTSDPVACKWLELFRRPAIDRLRKPNNEKLFATWKGLRYRVIGCSRLGDVWITADFTRENGYDHRVEVTELSAWSEKP
jgi:hypothetical protein